MLGPLILLFITVPLVELALLIWVGERLGTLTTVALVIGTGILGASLARFEGLATLRRFQTRLAQGELPHQDIIDGLLILLAGAVLLTPGLLTDTVGFLLLVPPVRAAVRRAIARRLAARVMGVPQGSSRQPRPDVGWSPRVDGAAGAGFTGSAPDPPDPGIVDAEYTVVEDSAVDGRVLEEETD